MHFQSHSILTQDIQYAVQMKALAMGSEHVGGSAAVILNSQCIMHWTVTQRAWLCEWINFHFNTFLLCISVIGNHKCHSGVGIVSQLCFYCNFDNTFDNP